MGLDNAGKTTLLENIKTQYGAKGLSPEQIGPTVGQNVGRVKVNNVLLKLWDLGGQESLRTLWESYYDVAHAVVFVVDSTDSDRIEECRDALDSMITNDKIEGIPVLMLANKQDREERMEVQDIKEIFNKIAEKMSARDSRVLPVSALQGTGVKDAVEWLTVRLVRNKQTRPPNLR